MTTTAEIVRRLNEAEEMFRGEPHDDYSIADDMALASERLSELQAEADFRKALNRAIKDGATLKGKRNG